MFRYGRISLLTAILTTFLLSYVIIASDLIPNNKNQEVSTFHASVAVETVYSPIPVKGDNKINLCYEIHISNMGRTPLKLTDIEVYKDENYKAKIDSYDDKSFPHMLKHFDNGSDNEYGFIDRGKRIAAFILIKTDDLEFAAPKLYHKLHFAEEGTSTPKISIIKAPIIEVNYTKPILIQSPLFGDSWLAAEGLVNLIEYSHHRFGMIFIDGKPWIAQRYAIDWLQFGDDGKLYKDDPSINENWYCYGENIYSVADGVVLEAKDGIPDNIPLADERAVPITLDTLCGNYILVDIGEGYCALYAHMIPGSVKVKPGDKVKAGQVLGLLGNSGNSDAPHLHFHISKKPNNNLLACEGVPFIIEGFYYEGRVPIPVKQTEKELSMDFMVWDSAPLREKISMEMPLAYRIYAFEAAVTD